MIVVKNFVNRTALINPAEDIVPSPKLGMWLLSVFAIVVVPQADSNCYIEFPFTSLNGPDIAELKYGTGITFAASPPDNVPFAFAINVGAPDPIQIRTAGSFTGGTYNIYTRAQYLG